MFSGKFNIFSILVQKNSDWIYREKKVDGFSIFVSSVHFIVEKSCSTRRCEMTVGLMRAGLRRQFN